MYVVETLAFHFFFFLFGSIERRNVRFKVFAPPVVLQIADLVRSGKEQLRLVCCCAKRCCRITDIEINRFPMLVRVFLFWRNDVDLFTNLLFLGYKYVGFD